jgi:hypothetical protein
LVLQLDHPFFTSANLTDAWARCTDPGDTDTLLGALLKLRAHRKLLPGSVFFTVPEGGSDDSGWRLLIESSQQYCACESRRIMYPLQGRTSLLREPRIRRIEVAFDADYSQRFYYDAPPVAFGPHGGSYQEAYAAFTVYDGGLRVETRPFMTDKRRGGLWTPMDGVALMTEGAWHVSFNTAADLMLLYGEVPFMLTIPDPLERRGYKAHLPLCKLVDCRREGDGVKYTLEVDFTVSFAANLRESDMDHICPVL